MYFEVNFNDCFENKEWNKDSFLLTVYEKVVKKVHSFIETRGGLTYLAGLFLIQSQLFGPSFKQANQTMNRVSQKNEHRVERFELPVADGTTLSGIIYYPKNWKEDDRSHCLVYNHPTRATLSQYFKEEGLSSTFKKIADIAQCPILLYDYRGTGLSKNQSYFDFWGATHQSILVDGEVALDYALNRFDSISVMGTSLGGGVAVGSLHAHLVKNPQDASRIKKLINLDSFSATSLVLCPYSPSVASWMGFMLGDVDVRAPMKNLIDLNISVHALSHEKDPVIPSNAKMTEYLKTLEKTSSVSIFCSKESGHAYLSSDMVSYLTGIF